MHLSCSLRFATYLLAALTLTACDTLPQPRMEQVTDKPIPTHAAPSIVTTPQAAHGTWPAWTDTTCTSTRLIDTPSQVLRRAAPQVEQHWYPKGKIVRVALRIEVTPQGGMGRVAYQPADTDARIIRAIAQSLKPWKFTPAMHEGQAVTTCFKQSYELIFQPQQ